MKRLPKIAIVGRPNVGKSALFNRIINKRISIVDEAEGVTRDRLYADGEHFGRPFEAIDTGGIDPHSDSQFAPLIRQQAEIAIEEADAIIMVVDGILGVTQLDHEVAQVLLRTEKPVVLAVNKVDESNRDACIHDFYCLGISKIIGVSALHNLQIVELLDLALEGLDPTEDYVADESIRIAVMGRANVGKSTLINALLHEDRCIVSPIPGTTRDAIDIPFMWKDQKYVLVDTAGVRRKHKETDVVEKFSAIRTDRALGRADICILVLDAVDGLTQQDKRIASSIEAAGKGCVMLLNKWDLVPGFRMEHCLAEIRREVPFLDYCPILCISAMKGRNLNKIFDEVRRSYEGLTQRVGTHELNVVIEKAMQRTHPPMVRGKRLRVYYSTQVAIQPPRIICFVNHADLMTEGYRRYLYNQVRDAFKYTGAPLVFSLKGKIREKTETSKPNAGQWENAVP